MSLLTQSESSMRAPFVPDAAESELTDEELTALALADDIDRPLDADAVPMGEFLGAPASLLPSWYMPVVTARGVTGWRVPVVLGLVAAFLVIEALGLCSTYGQLVVG